MRDFRDAKAMAHTLRAALATKGLKVTVSQSLELISQAFGVAGSHVRSALWQVCQNRFHKDRFHWGWARARAKRVRGGPNAPVWVLPSASLIWKRREYLRTPRC